MDVIRFARRRELGLLGTSLYFNIYILDSEISPQNNIVQISWDGLIDGDTPQFRYNQLLPLKMQSSLVPRCFEVKLLSFITIW